MYGNIHVEIICCILDSMEVMLDHILIFLKKMSPPVLSFLLQTNPSAPVDMAWNGT